MKIIAVDDEQLALTQLSKVFELVDVQVAELDLESNPLKAISRIKSNSYDIALLDIEIGAVSGFDLMEEIKGDVKKIVITTAYENYAIRALRERVYDYLLKPVELDDLNGMLNNYLEETAPNSSKSKGKQRMICAIPVPSGKLSIPSLSGFRLIDLMDITYIESENTYSKLHFKDGGSLWVTKHLKEFDSELSNNGFFRIHQSFLINLAYVTGFNRVEGAKVELLNSIQLPVARRKKDEFLSCFK